MNDTAVTANLTDEPGGASDPSAGAAPRRRARLVAVAVAVGAALAIWVVAELVFGFELQSPAFPGQPSSDIGPAIVVATAAIASLAGWGLLAALERVTARARALWTVTTLVVLVASLGGPLSGTGITAANRAVLTLMHLAVGAVLIPALARTSRGRTPS